MTYRYPELEPADYEPRLPDCDGSGEVYIECPGNHMYPCGGPDCTDVYIECPGCSACTNDDGPLDDEWISRAYEAGCDTRQPATTQDLILESIRHGD